MIVAGGLGGGNIYLVGEGSGSVLRGGIFGHKDVAGSGKRTIVIKAWEIIGGTDTRGVVAEAISIGGGPNI